MKPSEKQLKARRDLERRLDAQADKDRQASKLSHPEVLGRSDRTLIGCAHADKEQMKANHNWHCHYDYVLKPEDPDFFLAYSKIARFKSTKTTSKFRLYSGKQAKNLEDFRIDFIPDDVTGLTYQELASVLQYTREPILARAEIAIDFGPVANIDTKFVRKFFISGKTTPNGANQWGRRNGTKFIRCYFKKEIGALRLELQLNWRFLRRHHINTVSDFPVLATLLPRRHIFFARLDESKTIEWLRRDFRAKKAVEIMRSVNLQPDLWAKLQVLRTTGGLKNTTRLLVPLRTNRLVRQAMKQWASEWPESPVRLENAAAVSQVPVEMDEQ